MRWPFGKTYTIRCPDGSTKQVFRSLDDACPLYIPGIQGEISAKAGGKANPTGVNLQGEAKKKYAKKIEALIFGIDELTQTIMINFRNVYLAYSSDPCSNSAFFLRQIEMLVAEQQRIAKLRVQAHTLVTLIQAQPHNGIEILKLFQNVAAGIGGDLAHEVVTEQAKSEIAEARQLAGKWAEE